MDNEEVACALILLILWLKVQVISLLLKKSAQNIEMKRKQSTKTKIKSLILLYRKRSFRRKLLQRSTTFWEIDVQNFAEAQWLEHFRVSFLGYQITL